MSTAAALICPKCGGEMRTYERSGVHLDQCTECRGIFLDRGELEQLIDAADTHDSHEQAGDEHHDEHHHGDDYDEGRHGRRRRSGPASMLSDLLGGGGE